MAERRILRRDGQRLTVAVESRFAAEEDLHVAMAAHPEVLPSEDIGLGPLVALANELDVGHGPIDLLCADPTGRLVIVEFKRGTENPDVRKVVAQVLDYGASLWGLDYGDLDGACQKCDPGFDGSLADHVAGCLEAIAFDGFDPTVFQRGVADTLESGSFVFLYVGRDLDERTKRIMTFLAEGPRMSFFAVEVDYFRSPGGSDEVLVPRTAFVPSWAAAGSPEARHAAELPIGQRLADASDSVHRLIELMDGFAERHGLVVDHTAKSRSYRPRPTKQGVAIFPSSERAEFNLDSFRKRGEDQTADDMMRRLAAVTGEKVTAPVWPGVSCASLVREWERAETEVLVPYFEARANHYQD